MKMKFSLMLILALTLHYVLFAQAQPLSLPQSTNLPPYRLQVGYNTTTVLLFPSAIIAGDRGSSDLAVQKEKQLENVLKLKAVRKEFPTTNLHVYTHDGKVYSFTIDYADQPEILTYNLGNITTQMDRRNIGIPSGLSLSQHELRKLSEKCLQVKPFLGVSRSHLGITLQLKTIHNVNDISVLGFEVVNHSDLAYNTGAVRLYQKNVKNAKRSSVQEYTFDPLYVDLPSTIGGNNTVKFAVCVPNIVISDGKVLHIELAELNGGRRIDLPIQNRFLLRAKPL